MFYCFAICSSVDWKKAMSFKGVMTYVDSKDVPGVNYVADDEPLFATEKVCVYVCSTLTGFCKI